MHYGEISIAFIKIATSMESLNDLHTQLANYKICSTGEATLASTLHYLHLKHTKSADLLNDIGFNKALYGFKGDSVCVYDEYYEPEKLELALDAVTSKPKALLLDKNTLYRLQQDPDLRDAVQRKNIKLLYPDGWLEGINPFGKMDAEALLEKTKALLAQTAKEGGPTVQNSASFQMRSAIEELKLSG